ncbi:MAG: uncharacterized membrane protein YsdA (DUF1294 family) [Colwellia sp.]|jgi:uncharacterized membrane protein YsdA (DUF1294 family)
MTSVVFTKYIVQAINMFSKSVVVLFLMAFVLLFIMQKIALWVLVSYLSLSLLTFVLYGIDKRNAIKERWRISEKTLQVFALLGGWPGALLAQQAFRHKTQKQLFIFVLWFAIFINVVALGYSQYPGL